MRNRLKRSSNTPAKIVEQIEALLEAGDTVSIDRLRNGGYEVTVFDQWPRPDGVKNHSHYGGQTLAEAVNRSSKHESELR